MTARSATVWIALFAILAVAGLRLMADPQHSGYGMHGAVHNGGGMHGIDPGDSASARVIRVVDGDTAKVLLAGRKETVRYIGVDTPESVKPNTPVQCFAKAASHFNENLVEGKKVTLTFDNELRDRYGRLLAYITFNGRSVNAELIHGGYARTLEIAPNTTRANYFRKLEDDAQSAGRGLWGACQGER
ncbi:MAG: thermonuclease family protein [Thermoleophilaceae bacterium]|nr:thermonuclease family protein [Thermoleophilaceae bacterium]